MINMVYLILVLHNGGSHSQSMSVVQTPQASMKQCEINKNVYKKDGLVVRSYCIYGVMPK